MGASWGTQHIGHSNHCAARTNNSSKVFLLQQDKDRLTWVVGKYFHTFPYIKLLGHDITTYKAIIMALASVFIMIAHVQKLYNHNWNLQKLRLIGYKAHRLDSSKTRLI